ncbi:DUF4062 domain-containing protein [Vibrio cholerae]|uniref:DUF4062 domain-containing protein n=1 Tax=Vibrio cholerae TaxID=666 RepID=UPI00308022BE
MDTTKYQVFISSTYKDLEVERECIIKAILEMYHIPIGMEMFSAEDEDQWEIIRRTIEVSDYYILILGLRYGSKTSGGISFTQKEYEYALEKKIPILAFVMNDGVSLPKDKRDDDLDDINRFRQLVLDNSKMAQFWETKDELIKNVSISLMKQIMQKPGIGWIRGDKRGVEEELSKELTSLSKENRELRDKVAELEAKISPKIPKIEVNFAPLAIDEKYDDLEPKQLPTALVAQDIPEHLKEYIDADLIDNYNRSLPTYSQLEEYNSELNKKYKIDNFSSPLVIEVSNVGTCKAKNIYIEIEFPNELFVYENGHKFKEPLNPIPKNPLVKAEASYQKDLNKSLTLSSNVIQGNRDLGNVISDFAIASHVAGLPRIKPITQSWWTRLDKNKITVKIDNLLHTRRMTFDDEYFIAPLKLGNYDLKVKVICEEYDHEDSMVVNLPTDKTVL